MGDDKTRQTQFPKISGRDIGKFSPKRTKMVSTENRGTPYWCAECGRHDTNGSYGPPAKGLDKLWYCNRHSGEWWKVWHDAAAGDLDE